MDRPRLDSNPATEPESDAALALERLHESEARFRTLVEGMGEGFYLCELIWGADGHVADVRYLEENPVARATVGFAARGKRLSELNPGLDPDWLPILQRVARQGAGERFERFSPLIGRWFDYHVFPAATARNHIGVLFRDVTERHEAQTAIAASEERYRTLFDSIDEGFCVIEKVEGEPGAPLDFRYLEANAAFAEHAGTGSVVGRTIREAFPAEPEGWFETYDAVTKSGEPIRFERVLETHGRTLELYAFPVPGERRQVGVIFKDITLRKGTERALRESEQRFKLILQSMRDAVYVGTASGITIANAAALEQLGYDSREELNRHIGTLAQEIVTRDYATGEPIPAAQQAFARALRGEEVVQNVSIVNRKTGTERVLRCAASPLIEDGQIVAAVAVNTDITELKHNEAALRESEQRFRALVTAGSYSIYRMSPDWRLMFQLASESLGATDGPIEDWVAKYILEEDLPAVREAIDHAIRTRSMFELEHRVRLADGSVGWVFSRAIPLFDVKGEIVEWFGAGSVVTERREAVERLRESEERLRLIVENARDYAIFTMDREARIMDWREGAEAVFGYSRDEMIGRDADVLYTPEDRAAHEPEKERALAARTGKAPNVRWHVCKDGERVFIEGVCTALRDREGRLTGYLKIGRDASERHAAEARQNILLGELQHRVRNVLSVVRAVFTRTAEAGTSLEDIAEHFRGRLDALARTQVVVTQSSRGTADLENLVREELLSVAAGDSEGVTIEGPDVELPGEPAEALGLAVHELTTNSVKYGALRFPSASLSIRWSANVDHSGAGQLVFSWEEQGVPAMPVDPSREGFGTELITRALPYRLGAETTFELRPGGVRCTITLPLPSAAHQRGED